MPEKPKRIFIDPPGVEPEGMDELIKLTSTEQIPEVPEEIIQKWQLLATYPNLLRKWRMMFTGILYMFTGFTLWMCIQLEIPMEMVQNVFLVVGAFFFILSIILYKKTGETRLWK